jgi:dTDP-4-amino-4,6-dideoxygalactose transaminase
VTTSAPTRFAAIPYRAPADGFANVDRLMDHALSLPPHHGLTSDDLGYLVKVVEETFR